MKWNRSVSKFEVRGSRSEVRRPRCGRFAAKTGAQSGRWLLVPAALSAVLLARACRQDMHNQPKYIPLRDSALFTNGSSARPLVEDTVARGTLQDDEAFFTGKTGGA